jgi:hypothetical protein
VKPKETSIARQWLGECVPVATNMHAAIEEIIYVVFSMQSVSSEVLNM